MLFYARVDGERRWLKIMGLKLNDSGGRKLTDFVQNLALNRL